MKIFKMIRNKTLILSLLVLSACCKQSGEDEQQKGYYSQSLFDPYIAQGSIFTREVKNYAIGKELGSHSCLYAQNARRISA